jgi:hypothetical protein
MSVESRKRSAEDSFTAYGGTELSPDAVERLLQSCVGTTPSMLATLANVSAKESTWSPMFSALVTNEFTPIQPVVQPVFNTPAPTLVRDPSVNTAMTHQTENTLIDEVVSKPADPLAYIHAEQDRQYNGRALFNSPRLVPGRHGCQDHPTDDDNGATEEKDEDDPMEDFANLPVETIANPGQVFVICHMNVLRVSKNVQKNMVCDDEGVPLVFTQMTQISNKRVRLDFDHTHMW